jgi:hypothetical protein
MASLRNLEQVVSIKNEILRNEVHNLYGVIKAIMERLVTKEWIVNPNVAQANSGQEGATASNGNTVSIVEGLRQLIEDAVRYSGTQQEEIISEYEKKLNEMEYAVMKVEEKASNEMRRAKYYQHQNIALQNKVDHIAERERLTYVDKKKSQAEFWFSQRDLLHFMSLLFCFEPGTRKNLDEKLEKVQSKQTLVTRRLMVRSHV